MHRLRKRGGLVNDRDRNGKEFCGRRQAQKQQIEEIYKKRKATTKMKQVKKEKQVSIFKNDKVNRLFELEAEESDCVDSGSR